MGVTYETARKVLMIMSFVLFVGAPRIGLGLLAPKASVLPVYYAPSSLRRSSLEHRRVSSASTS